MLENPIEETTRYYAKTENLSSYGDYGGFWDSYGYNYRGYGGYNDSNSGSSYVDPAIYSEPVTYLEPSPTTVIGTSVQTGVDVPVSRETPPRTSTWLSDITNRTIDTRGTPIDTAQPVSVVNRLLTQPISNIRDLLYNGGASAKTPLPFINSNTSEGFQMKPIYIIGIAVVVIAVWYFKFRG